jgi:predicted Zn-dependent protease
MAQGIEKGGLRQPEAARLRWAYAQLLADQKDPARKTLQAITGASPEALLARLWLLHLQAKT